MKIARLLAASWGWVTARPMDPAERLRINRELMLECLEKSARFQPDFVLFPELALNAATGPMPGAGALAEPLPGPTFERVAAAARKLGSHVILPMYEREGDRLYNTAALIGRDGALMGRYRKFHATGYEIREGVMPGEDVPVWQTDRGRVGCAICFDLKFPIVGLSLSRRNAQCVFFPTMFYGGARLVSWAMDYGFHIVRCHAAGGRIVEPTGQTVAIEGPPEPLGDPEARVKWTFAEVNLDHRTYHFDFHREKLEAVCRKYGAGVSIRRMPDEGTFNLASNLAHVSIEDLEREFQLQSLRSYLDEAEDIRRRILQGETP